MPQEQKPQEPTANFTAKAGLPGSPQPLEVKPLATDIKPWDLDQLPKFEHMGKARSRTEGPLKVTGRAEYVDNLRLPYALVDACCRPVYEQAAALAERIMFRAGFRHYAAGAAGGDG